MSARHALSHCPLRRSLGGGRFRFNGFCGPPASDAWAWGYQCRGSTTERCGYGDRVRGALQQSHSADGEDRYGR